MMPALLMVAPLIRLVPEAPLITPAASLVMVRPLASEIEAELRLIVPELSMVLAAPNVLAPTAFQVAPASLVKAVLAALMAPSITPCVTV